MNTEIKAKVLLDTEVEGFPNSRVITISTQSPIYLDAEIEKHGNLASNTSSTRAIGFPVTKIHDHVPFLPDEIYQSETSMHGVEEISPELLSEFRDSLDDIYTNILATLEPYKKLIHKQHLNRYIAPFALQTKVITGNFTSWENFIKLRSSKYAQPEIRNLANLIESAIEDSIPVNSNRHMPLVDDDELEELSTSKATMLSAGRVARYSYGITGQVEEDSKTIDRATRLIDLEHKSPYEHQLTHIATLEICEGLTHVDVSGNRYSGRIRDWVQARKMIWGDEIL